MKRIFIFIICFMMIFSLCGCGNRTKHTINTSSITKTTSTANTVSTGGAKIWPTDSWTVSTPNAQGLDPAGLAKADACIKQSYKNVYSLLVVRHGYLIYEKYYNGAEKDTANPVYSVTKSFMSALTGIAIQQKLIKGVDQPVAELVPDYFKGIDNVNKKEITIKDVLTMTGGLESIDSNYSWYFSASDWLAQTLKKPLINKPGTKFDYNTGLIQFLSNIITKTSGMDTKAYAQKYLFSKINIKAGEWVCDSKGYCGGGFGITMTPRDLAKFGYLYLHNGEWNGKQIIPKVWVKESTQKHLHAYDDMDYGYLFWVQTAHDPVKKTDYFTYRADGAGGQKVIVVPQLDMIAVITAISDNSFKDKTQTQDIVFKYVLPAVKN